MATLFLHLHSTLNRTSSLPRQSFTSTVTVPDGAKFKKKLMGVMLFLTCKENKQSGTRMNYIGCRENKWSSTNMKYADNSQHPNLFLSYELQQYVYVHFIHIWAAIPCSTSQIRPFWPRPRVRLGPLPAFFYIVSSLFVSPHPSACYLFQQFFFHTCTLP